jgi:ubiquinone/menaquinone biosynthesis C-methylase UbiE
MRLDDSLAQERFPRSARYDRDWMIANSMGPNAVWLTEFLSEALELRPGMKVLDLGCGKAMSSVFLAREFGVEVWANDLWIPAADNEKRIRDAGLVDQIHAVHAEARSLPYDNEAFDAIVSLDAFHYFGTDDLYLGYLAEFLEPGGFVGIVSPGLVTEFEGDPPDHLRPVWHWEFATFHSPAWWFRHWDRIGKFDVELADWLEDGWKFWAHWDCVCEEALGIKGDADMVEADAGRNLGFVRVVAKLHETQRWRN